MPEVILPCPACGSTELQGHLAIRCTCCYMRGPECASPEIAAEEWNSLPRALRWTHEPPKVAGVYLIRSMFDGEQQGEIGVITVKTPFGYDKSHFMQFAGPIAPPIEP